MIRMRSPRFFVVNFINSRFFSKLCSLLLFTVFLYALYSKSFPPLCISISQTRISYLMLVHSSRVKRRYKLSSKTLFALRSPPHNEMAVEDNVIRDGSSSSDETDLESPNAITSLMDLPSIAFHDMVTLRRPRHPFKFCC